jgi:hypothetical protein
MAFEAIIFDGKREEFSTSIAVHTRIG